MPAAPGLSLNTNTTQFNNRLPQSASSASQSAAAGGGASSTSVGTSSYPYSSTPTSAAAPPSRPAGLSFPNLGGPQQQPQRSSAGAAPGGNLSFGSSNPLPAGLSQGQQQSSTGAPIDLLNDFPALGQQQAAAAAAAAAAQAAQANGQAPGGPITASTLLSSYASQAGTTGASLMPGGANGRLGQGANASQAFTTDDFPSLDASRGGGGMGAAGATGQGGTATFLNAANGLPNQSQLQEQASAAAALQHQQAAREAHRRELLGGMSGQAGQGMQVPSQLQMQQGMNAARGGFGDPERNYATKLGAPLSAGASWAPPAGGYSASGPNGALLRSPHPSSATSAAQAAGTPQSQVQGPGGYLPSQAVVPSGEMPQTPAQQVLVSPADRFGLMGLLSIIKMQDPDLSMLAMGADLQTLGLNLNAQEALYSSFITPWSDSATAPPLEPDFHLPSCYNMQPPPPAQSKIASFADETLFFIFYATPRDVLQEVAAQELYNRNWRYHKELHLWLTKEQNTEPTQKTPTYERGNYVFFDPVSWEKVTKNFVLMYELLEEKGPHISAAQAQAHAQALHHAQSQGQPGQGQSHLQQQAGQPQQGPGQQQQQQGQVPQNQAQQAQQGQ